MHFVSDYEYLIYEQRGPVTIITINRPERMNAIGPQTHRELIDAWDRFRSDDIALVGVLTGAGDTAFCADGDLKAAFAGELVDASPAEIAAHDRGERPGVLGPSRWTDIYTGTCVQRALELAQTIAALPQPALRSDLEAARSGQGRPLDDGLRIEAHCFNRSIFASETYPRHPRPRTLALSTSPASRRYAMVG